MKTRPVEIFTYAIPYTFKEKTSNLFATKMAGGWVVMQAGSYVDKNFFNRSSFNADYCLFENATKAILHAMQFANRIEGLNKYGLAATRLDLTDEGSASEYAKAFTAAKAVHNASLDAF